MPQIKAAAMELARQEQRLPAGIQADVTERVATDVYGSGDWAGWARCLLKPRSSGHRWQFPDDFSFKMITWDKDIVSSDGKKVDLCGTYWLKCLRSAFFNANGFALMQQVDQGARRVKLSVWALCIVRGAKQLSMKHV